MPNNLENNTFPLWKMLNNTILDLKLEWKEENVKRLTSIIKKKDFENIFLYQKDASLSYEEFTKISNFYTAYTTWILGRFFYILGKEKLFKVHDVLIDAQLYILNNLARRQINVFYDLSREYANALHLLTSYIQKSNIEQHKGGQFVLNVFIPEKFEELSKDLDLTPIFIEVVSKINCLNLISHTIKFIDAILEESFLHSCFNKYTNLMLDDLIYLLQNCEIKIKLSILKVFCNALQKYNEHESFGKDIDHKLQEIMKLCECLAMDIYNKKISIKTKEFNIFEEIFLLILKRSKENNKLRKCSTQFGRFAFEKILNNTSKGEYNFALPIQQELENGFRELTLNLTEEENINIAKKCIDNSNSSAVNIFFYYLKQEILNYCKDNHSKVIKIYEISKIWKEFHIIFVNKILMANCATICKVNDILTFFNSVASMLFDLMTVDVAFIFYNEEEVLINILAKLNHHFECCTQRINSETMLRFFVNFAILSQSNNLDIIFNIVIYSFVRPGFLNQSQISSNFIGTCDLNHLKKLLLEFYKNLTKYPMEENKSLQFATLFIKYVSSGLMLNLNNSQILEIEQLYYQIMKNNGLQENVLEPLIQSIPNAITIFSKADRILNEVILRSLTQATVDQKIKFIEIIPNIICITHSDFVKVISHQQYVPEINVDIFCEKCYSKNTVKHEYEHKQISQIRPNYKTCAINFGVIKLDMTSFVRAILNYVLQSLTSDNESLKVAVLKVLPSLSQHILKFNTLTSTRIWIELIGDSNSNIRTEFSKIVFKTIHNALSNNVVPQNEKTSIMEILMETLLKFTKKSLQLSNYDLQLSILSIIEQVIDLKLEELTSDIVKLLLYFLMVPTSKYSMIAVENFYYLAEKNNLTPHEIYRSNSQDFCKTIVHLCAINQSAANVNLATSLCKISVILDFGKIADFVQNESQYLLPFFVSKAVHMKNVTKLIDEMASLMHIDTPELLTLKYGYIFLEIFLNHREDFSSCMDYVAAKTKLSNPNLRKKKFRVILNHLLLNFHENRERVIMALTFLLKEDKETRATDLPNYIQPHFLGILQIFLNTFICNPIKSEAKKVLLSLADIFNFMGSRHILPLRFKIISMLQTINCSTYPLLLANVWESFLKSCEIEALGPQLATIFVSVQPLLIYCQNKVNSIFQYLICENEQHVKDYISDLFFVQKDNLDKRVLSVINKHLKQKQNNCFKNKMKVLLKYLTHETVEVRIEAFRQVKNIMEENREELDRMILGYNGIDDTLVELIDILTLGCKEKDENIRLICGDVIGELGAVEPSHLPRRYTEDTNTFSFYIYEDNFLISSLNELAKALQADTNAANVDRSALAIQEILKTYNISNDTNCTKHYLWQQLPESQQELMLPLLSSRYTVSHSVNSIYANASPIYSSNPSFQSWLYNWTCSLISTLPSDKKTLLEACLPSMKDGHRVLLQFLPHILFHSLVEGNSQDASYLEFETVINAFHNRKTLDPNITNIIVLPSKELSIVNDNKKRHDLSLSEEMQSIKCTKVVFILLDFLNRWVIEWTWQNGILERNHPHFKIVKDFLKRFSKLQLAKCNYQCGEYPRALMYLEDYINENPNSISDNLTFLAEVYAQLDEPDGVAGTTSLRITEPSVEERILGLEVSGKLADAAACYERMSPILKLHHIRGLMQCYLDLDNVNTALHFAQAAIKSPMDFGNTLLEDQAEPLWRLSRYDDLDNLLQRHELKNNKSWGVQIGHALIHFKNENRDDFKKLLDGLKLQQVSAFGATSFEQGAYQHGYSYVARLHALNELQQVEKVVNELLLRENDNELMKNLVKKLKYEWELRIKVVQESVKIVEPILCLRRVALEQGKRLLQNKMPRAVERLNSLLGESWLLSAKTARVAGVHQQAYTYGLKAEEFAPPNLFIEKAELHWLREENEQALTTLKRGLEKLIPISNTQNLDNLTLDQRKICAEARLLIATFNDSTSNVDTTINTQNYLEALEVYKEWEKSLVAIGQYYDRIFESISSAERDERKGSEMQIRMINYFGKSLLYGTSYVYQSLPRMLSIWFDYGTRLLEVKDKTQSEERRAFLLKMTKLVDNFSERVPSYIFLTALSQIVSRICHPQKEVFRELGCIIVKLLLKYPQQTLWAMIPVVKSTRCQEIFRDSNLKTMAMSKLLKDFTSLAEKLIELCNKDIPHEGPTSSVNLLLRSLPRLLAKDDFSQIMIPIHKFRKLILPNPDFKNGQHDPFPNNFVYIVSLCDEVTILPSLQKPRKITFRASDGNLYIQMLKPKDDLRKDFRLMEFNDVVNQLLSQEAESRLRRLNIRLYSVAPLNEECGLIEWVPNLVGLRPILMNIYKQRGLGMKNKEIKDASAKMHDTLEKKKTIFKNIFIQKHPPLLGEWFRKVFPDTQSWLTARTAYIRTMAVMSMVGYILGLGDRHGENILLDSVCGDVVHVDFNCLFNKGESFEWPERVPFRLTHNMISAMGPLGIEGVFRKACACTLKVLRTNTNTLTSIVRPFVYDPLVTWPGRQSHSSANLERTNEQALEHLKNIELRLQGIIIKARTSSLPAKPLSVEGQVNVLINESKKIENLCQMFIGWGAYL